MKSTYLLPWLKMTTWYFRLSRLLEVPTSKSAPKIIVLMPPYFHVGEKSCAGRIRQGDEAPPTPGGRNGGSDVL